MILRHPDHGLILGSKGQKVKVIQRKGVWVPDHAYSMNALYRHLPDGATMCVLVSFFLVRLWRYINHVAPVTY